MPRIAFMKTWSVIILVLVSCGLLPEAAGHEMRPGYLEIRESTPTQFEVFWKVPARGDTFRFGLYLQFSDEVEVLAEPVSGFSNNAHIQRMRIQHPRGLVGASITIDGLDNTLTDVLFRLERLEAPGLTHLFTPDAPSYVVASEPGFKEVAGAYFVLGVEHILLGIDHLLFVLALLLIVKGWGKLVATITSFTLAHSITLALATLGFLRVPGPPVEAIIALSIVFVASEIIHVRQGRESLTARRPWIVAFAFGLLHGLGFAGALNEIGLPSSSIPLALVMFNLGVETGQLLFVAILLVVYALLRPVIHRLPGAMELVPPYAIGGVAVFWLIERVFGFWD